MEAQLRAFTTQDYQEILNLPKHLAVVLTSDGVIVKSSEASILGWLPEMTRGKSIDEFVWQGDLEAVKNVLAKLNNHPGEIYNIRIRCLNMDKEYRWISWSGILKNNLVYAIGTDETDKVELESALAVQSIQQKEFQTRFITFFEQSTLPTVIYSLTGSPLAMNKAWKELFNATCEDLESYNILNGFQFKGTPIEDHIQRAYEGEALDVPAFYYDPSLFKKSGRSRWLEAWISPVKDDMGNIREIAMVLKDVTEKIQTQKALIKSISERKAAEEKYQVISNRFSLAAKTGNIGLWEWTPGSNIVKWDETTEKIYGFSPGTFPMTVEAFNECIYPDDREFLWATISEAMDNKNSYIVDHRAVTPDGRELWLQESGMALFDDNGRPYHMMGTVIDITERKNAEEDQKFLSLSSEFLLGSFDHREILEKLCYHAIDYFCDGCFIDELMPDGKLKRTMVVHPDPLICKKILEIDKNFSEKFKAEHPFLKSIESGRPVYTIDAEFLWDKMREKLGEELYQKIKSVGSKTSINVRLKGREKVLGVITFFTLKDSRRSLTKRHIWLAEELAYRASMAFENVLIHQKSLEAIKTRDEFLSIASHELKTPLQSLTLQNQMRKRNLDKNLVESFSPGKISSMIEADLKHLSRIKRLIDDMLDISRIRAGKLTFMIEKFGLCGFVKDVLERFRPQIEAVGCQSTIHFCDEVMVEADMYRIEQVLVNILTNAVKYGAGRPIKIILSSDDCLVKIAVEDKGYGIKQDDIERIFERFERAISSNEVSGLGLGLYISRQIMEQHRGRLFAKSHPGEGSTFIMELPIIHEISV